MESSHRQSRRRVFQPPSLDKGKSKAKIPNNPPPNMDEEDLYSHDAFQQTSGHGIHFRSTPSYPSRAPSSNNDSQGVSKANMPSNAPPFMDEELYSHDAFQQPSRRGIHLRSAPQYLSRALSSNSDSQVLLSKKRSLAAGNPNIQAPRPSKQSQSSQSCSQPIGLIDDEDEDFLDECMVHETLNMMSLACIGATLCYQYFDKYLLKQSVRVSRCSGWQWLTEVLSTPGECYRMLRMETQVFLSLSTLLKENYGLKSTRAMRAEEALAIFIYSCAHNQSNRELQNRFKHSGETISRKFGEVLNVLIKFSKDIVKPCDPTFQTVPSQIRGSDKYWPHFKGCIGAIDGTHVPAVVSSEDAIPYIGRKQYPTQNVLVICDFDMLFTFFVAGWPGSVHDNRILKDALEDSKKVFPHPPEGKYYVVDAGYPNMKGYLAPFKGQKYHLPDFRRSSQPPTGFCEVFNYNHASLRNVVERTIGIWKNRWAILRNMPSFSLQVQNKIIGATMAIHNYIRRNALEDLEFDKCDVDPDYMPDGGNLETDPNIVCEGSMDDREMEIIRHRIAASLMK